MAPSSVSRVLNEHPDVSQEMRAKVLQAAEQLGYQPNFLAQSLRTGATRTVGFVVRDISIPLFAGIVKGAEQALEKNGYSVLLTNSLQNSALEAKHINVLRQRRVDGLILSLQSEANPDTFMALQNLQVPTVLLDRELVGFPTDAVLFDHASGVHDAVAALVERGHTHIGLLVGPPDTRASRDRILGFTRGMRGGRYTGRVGQYRPAFGHHARGGKPGDRFVARPAAHTDRAGSGRRSARDRRSGRYAETQTAPGARPFCRHLRRSRAFSAAGPTYERGLSRRRGNGGSSGPDAHGPALRRVGAAGAPGAPHNVHPPRLDRFSERSEAPCGEDLFSFTGQASGPERRPMMDFLVEIEVRLPPDTSPGQKAELIAAEAARAKDLSAKGTIYRLWRVPGRWANVGIWRAEDATELHEAISSLPLYPWLEVDVTPLATHPSDPGPP